MKKIFITIILMLVISLFPNVVSAKTIEPDYSWYGNGDKTNYEIYTEEQLLAFANIVNGKAENINKNTFKDQKITLKKDLDLTGIIWTPIGSSMYDHSPESPNTKMFEGTFDGGYHTITGLSSDGYTALPEDISSGEHSYGLFGYGYGASVLNLNLKDVSIHCSGEAGADGAGVAAVIGFYVPKNNTVSVIDNVHVLSGEIQATNNMGGIIGYAEIMGSKINVDLTIKNSTNHAKVITDAREAGGIFGLFQNASGHKGSLKFINCINYGEVIANPGAASTVASGILGKEQSYSYKKYELKVYFENCRNEGNITVNGKKNGESHAAGISTVFYTDGAPLVVNNCVNTGNITINGESNDNFISGIIAHPAIGETNEIDAILQNSSYNLGNITSLTSSAIIITYDVNGANGNEASIRIKPNTNTKLSTGSNLSRDGYIFTGWNTKIDGTGTHYEPGETTKFQEATTLYAEWRKEKTTWNVISIPRQIYTGKPIKPAVYVFDKNNNIIESSKYTVTYEKNENCINVGKHIVKVTYNNETIDLDYEIIKGRISIDITSSSNTVKGNETFKLTVTGAESNNVKVICDDKEVIIKNNGNNTFNVTVPNKDNTYLFTAISSENNNHYESSASTLVTGIKTNETKNPNTSDNIYKSFIALIISIICLSTVVLVKKNKIIK